MARDLSGKTALVTGAAGAIGSAISRRLAEEGAHVVLVDLPTSPLGPVAEALGDACTIWQIDLSETAGILEAGSDLADRVHGIDILVNNAGILSNNKLALTNLDEWRSVHTVNLEAAFALTKCFVPHMRSQRWGRIINMSSYAAKSGGLTAGTAYSVSKAGLIGLTFSTAREVASEGVTVNAIAPAYVVSPMTSERLSEEQRRAQMAALPVGRFCTPEEVAHTAAFLASPLSGFITGEVIDMNGGLQFD
ncbi:MAG: SDR family oxidoreductase [Devosia sp.]